MEATTACIRQADPASIQQASTASTSTVSASLVQQAGTVYLMDEGEMEHTQKKRKIEIQLLEEQIKTQKLIQRAMEEQIKTQQLNQKAMANIAQKFA